MSTSFHSNPNVKYNIEYWYELNKKLIEHLFVKCNEISREYGIDFISNQHSFNHFIRMLYHHSEGYAINYDLFPEYAY